MLRDSTYPAVIGRALIALPFLLSGVGKIAAPAFTQGYIASVGLPLPLVAYAIAVVIEVGGSLLLLLGVQTRLTAVALAIFTLATAFAFHTNFADQNQMFHFLKNVVIVGGLLQVVAFGAGNFSVDAWLERRRNAAASAPHTRAVA
ncbi:MAG TPA: DoxX family protein [Stellaceae bacterium]|nr:DoxX family protein [Stellaceae bacterium]